MIFSVPRRPNTFGLKKTPYNAARFSLIRFNFRQIPSSGILGSLGKARPPTLFISTPMMEFHMDIQ